MCLLQHKTPFPCRDGKGACDVGGPHAAVQDWVLSGGGEGFITGIVGTERNAKGNITEIVRGSRQENTVAEREKGGGLRNL